MLGFSHGEDRIGGDGVSGATILIADDHPLFRDALKLAVQRVDPLACVAEAASLSEAIKVLRDIGGVDLILLDLGMADTEGFAGLAQLHAERPSTPILVVSGADAGSAARGARDFGAVGFTHKSASLDAIAQAVRRALSGETAWPDGPDLDPDQDVDGMARRIATLTPAQLKVLIGILSGQLNKQIAYDMGISEATVKAHVTVVMRKLAVRNRTQAALAARALAMPGPPPGSSLAAGS